MPEDWSQAEVEIIVEDYLAMLRMELRGVNYNKAERNREVRKLLPMRSRGSIEFKHQNISAVMIEMGYPYVEGYKPARNFQRTVLPHVVERRLRELKYPVRVIGSLGRHPVTLPEWRL